MAVGGLPHGQGAFWGDLVGPNPTDRGKPGTKISVLTEGDGGPLGIELAGANVPDSQLLESTIDSIVVPRPDTEQHLCLDKGYDNPTGKAAAVSGGHVPHIRPIREETSLQTTEGKSRRRHKPRRWVVERTLGWLCRCRAILDRHAKKSVSYRGLIQVACMLLWFRRLHRLLSK